MDIRNILVETEVDKQIEVKKVQLHMSEKQLKTARGLIKETCSNYDCSTGGCLRLDNGFVVPCPQMSRQSVVCKFFRDVLLEDKRAKELKAEIFSPESRKVCAACGGHFHALSNRAKYCAKCSKEQQRQKATERKRKQRGQCHALERESRCGATLF